MRISSSLRRARQKRKSKDKPTKSVRYRAVQISEEKLGTRKAMVRVDIKPISVNDCWQGRRFKTPAYKAFEEEMLYVLPKVEIPTGKLKIALTVGVSSKASDIDNPIKPTLDILQKKYGFNDRDIYRLEIDKVIVSKGKEFIEFDLSTDH